MISTFLISKNYCLLLTKTTTILAIDYNHLPEIYMFAEYLEIP